MSENPKIEEKPKPPKVCPLCRGARHLQNSVTKEVRTCWECNAGGTVDKSLIAGRRWA